MLRSMTWSAGKAQSLVHIELWESQPKNVYITVHHMKCLGRLVMHLKIKYGSSVTGDMRYFCLRNNVSNYL